MLHCKGVAFISDDDLILALNKKLPETLKGNQSTENTERWGLASLNL